MNFFSYVYLRLFQLLTLNEIFNYSAQTKILPKQCYNEQWYINISISYIKENLENMLIILY